MSISQRIENILNGVSQQPPALRHPSEATEQINALALPSRGVSIRPPTKHVSQLASVTTGAPNYFVHRFRTPTNHYVLVISSGTIRVFDEVSGAELPVTISDAGYLTGTDFRAATSGGVTYIINRDKVVAAGTVRAPSALNDALLYVRQVDYSTTYTVTISENVSLLPARITGKVTGTGNAKVSYTTPDGTDPKARQGITTDNIALSLYSALAANTYLSTYYTFELIGSTIYITRPDGKPFSIQADDGLADKGLNAIKGSVQSFDDLPARAKNGFIVEIVGDDSSEFDRYWVKYDDTDGGTGHGVWKECAAPASLISVDPSSMPHKLVLGAEYLTATVGALPPTPKVQDGTGKTVVSGPTHTGTIPGPSDTNPSDGTTTAALPNVDTQTTDHGNFHQWNVSTITGALTDPTLNQVSAEFHVDTAVMDPGTTMTVQLQQLNGAGVAPTVIAQRDYEAGQSLQGETLSGQVSLSGQPIVLQQLYKTGATPLLTFRKGTITVPGV